MNDYTVTYWTGTVHHVQASSLHGAYIASGYTDDDESTFWGDDDTEVPGMAQVTGRYGDLVATIHGVPEYAAPEELCPSCGNLVPSDDLVIVDPDGKGGDYACTACRGESVKPEGFCDCGSPWCADPTHRES